MKRILCMVIVVLMAAAVRPAAGSGNAPASPRLSGDAVPVRLTAPVTEETAYEGIKNYCRHEFGQDLGEEELDYRLEMGEETESCFQVIFRSYTGAIVTFSVEKSDGTTWVNEYVPVLDVENEAGAFNLYDFLGNDRTEAGSFGNSSKDAPEGRFVFRPKVCSVYLEELFGRTMCEAWYRLVDAVMAGEDTFACPDQHTYDWVMGQFPERCFPVLTELIDLAWDREHSVVDGVAGFTWLVPREEASERIAEFAAQIEGILNDALEENYSDFEKALALYNYFPQHYWYDFDTFERMDHEYVDEISTIRFFNTGSGVCQEISAAYSYLLMQAGVDATIMMGEGHQWSFVRINGKNYHIDPTFVLSDSGFLAWFMMTDEQRAATGYSKDRYIIASNYAQDHPHPDCTADDDTFRPLWDKVLGSFSHEDHMIYCPVENENGGRSCFEFDYAGY